MNKKLPLAALVFGLAFNTYVLNADDSYHEMESHHHPRYSVEERVNRLTKTLNLTAEQQSSLKTVFEEKRSRMENLWEEKKRIDEETDTKIESMLTDDQKKKYATWKENKKEHNIDKLKNKSHKENK
jgi:Spy/CpxP family protein refolding chaperone